MKTLAEKLDDLKAKFKDAKTDDERTKIVDAIDEVIKDAKKVTDSLTKANDEAKTSREESKTTKGELDAYKKANPPKEITKTPEEIAAELKAKEKGDEVVPEWAKKLIEKVETFEKDTATSKKDTLILEILKEKKLPESLAKYVNVNSEDKAEITKSIESLEQDLKDEEILSVPDPNKAETGAIGDELIKSYAKGKNDPSGSNKIVGKQIEVD